MNDMNRTEIAPIMALQPIVKRFWYLERAHEVFNRHAIYPDSYREIIISLGAPLEAQSANGSWFELPRAYISPLQTIPQNLRALGQCRIIAVSLYPWGVAAFDPYATANPQAYIPLDDAWQRAAVAVSAAVNRRGYADGVALLQQFVSEESCPVARGADAISKAGHLIYAQRGQVSVSDLAANCYISPSQLERGFKTLAGLTPKSYARLVRFETIRNAIVINPSRGLADLASEHGYTDQAHLTHDFKAFAGRTPGRFAAESKDYTMDWQPADFLQYA